MAPQDVEANCGHKFLGIEGLDTNVAAAAHVLHLLHMQKTVAACIANIPMDLS